MIAAAGTGYKCVNAAKSITLRALIISPSVEAIELALPASGYISAFLGSVTS